MKLFALVILSIGIASCSAKSQKFDLAGTYVFKIKESKQEIIINPDGTYVNNLYENNKILWSEKNKWEYETMRGHEGMVTFDGFRFKPDEFKADKSGAPRRGLWVVEPEKSWTGVRKLCFDPDLYRCFEAK
jgi:hypothetical protein